VPNDIIEPLEVIGLIIGQDELAKRHEKLHAELARAVDELKKMGAERIVLIGSMAEGNTGPFSDIDLVVVMPTQERFLDRLKAAYGRIQPSVAMDILVYSPQELDDLRKTSAFIFHALEKGRILYAA
jgi:predicted nucleotidyltransferase